MAVATGTRADVAVERLDVSAYTIPVEGGEESDGTLVWHSTTIVVIEAHAGGQTGIGYTYADAAAATLVRSKLASLVEGADAMSVRKTWRRMGQEIRNAGRPGVGMMAISAVDTALWDLKARLLGVPLFVALDPAFEAVPIYGSGGFTNYSLDRLREQVAGWVDAGIPRVKIKVGRDARADPRRLDVVREEIGDDVELYVDGNGAYTRKQALSWAHRFAGDWGVSWFEEPVSSADLEGLRLLRDRGPGGMDVAAGEYAFVPADFRNLLEAGAVDCLQADVTRCGGITGFLQAAALAAGHSIDVSGHTAPALHVHACCAVPHLRHLEYFHDHTRIEAMLFDGLPEQDGGYLRPDPSRPGNGLEVKRRDAERVAVTP